MSWFRFRELMLIWCAVSSSIAQEEENQIHFGGLPMPVSFPLDCLPSKDMVDASGNIPAGINSGNIVELGAFDQCIGIKEIVNYTDEVIKGKYCIMKIVLPNKNKIFSLNNPFLNAQPYDNKFETKPKERGMTGDLDPNEATELFIGWCLPNTCNMSKVENIFKLIGIQVTPVSEGLLCQTEDDIVKKLNESDWGVIGFFIFVLIVIALSTIYDIYLHFVQKHPAHLLLVAFSLKTNSEKLLSIHKNHDQLPCLNGLRFISMMWLILYHKHDLSPSFSFINRFDARDWSYNDVEHMYLTNASVFVDTFLVLSGLLLSYGFCLTKNKGVHFNIPKFYIHRYLRLTPVLGVIILIHATILPYFGSGPLWPSRSSDLKEPCVKYWWVSLVYIQNYYALELCLPQTWYLAVDFQLYILSPLILIPLWKWPKHTMIASVLLVVGSIISSFLVTFYYELELPTNINDAAQQQQTKATHIRFGPWLMGLMLGYYLFKLKKDGENLFRCKLNVIQILLGWAIALAIMFACLFGSYNLFFKHDNLSNAFWYGLHRHGWALGVCWVIFACTQGYGGVINSFLSCPVFQVLGKFTYTIYLVHLSIQILEASASRTSHFFGEFYMLYEFWGDLFLSLGISSIFILAFESPMVTIEKVIFSFGRKK